MAVVICAGEPATDGEVRAAERLAHLPDDWLVVCNKMVVIDADRSFEVDFVIVGQRHVFVVDEKSWSGQITGNDQVWVRSDGIQERSPLNKADYVAKVLAGQLRQFVPRLGDVSAPFVSGCVLLSRQDRLPQIADPRVKARVFLFDDVCHRLEALDGDGGDVVISQMRDKIKDRLVGFWNRPKVPKSIGLYTVTDVGPSRPGCRVFDALLEGVGPRRLFVYDVSGHGGHEQEKRNFYMREFTAIKHLLDTELVPDIGDPFLWSDDSFLVVPVLPPSGVPLSKHPLPTTQEEFVDELALAAAAFRGLTTIREAGVLHRAVGPETLYVLEGGRSPRVAFADFYAARVGSNTIGSQLDELVIDDEYAAPEVRIGYGLAEERSDSYSLSLVFLQRWSGTPVATLRQSATDADKAPDLHAKLPFLPRATADRLVGIMHGALAPGPMAPKGTSDAQRLTDREISDKLSALVDELCPEHPIGNGVTVDGRYIIRRLLGQGTMAMTYLATDQLISADVAVKHFINPQMVDEQTKSEFLALRGLGSKRFPRIYDIYEPQNYVHAKMEYIPGPSLESKQGEFPWPIDRWWPLTQELMDAVEELERHKILHRDIKPANIILHQEDGGAVLIDFGFATVHETPTPLAGSYPYLPPEAVSMAHPPLSTDRYALCVLLFQMLTGHLPFMDVNGRYDKTKLVELSANPKTERLEKVLLKAVSPDPAERPGSTHRLREQLRAAMEPPLPPPRLKAADAVWIATALLHREHPEQEDFPVADIVDRVRQEKLYEPILPVIRMYASQNCVANKRPMGPKLRMLYETPSKDRRLFRDGDDEHPARGGQIVPVRQEIPQTYWYLLDWYENLYKHSGQRPQPENATPESSAESTSADTYKMGIDIVALLAKLASERPIFHDEADFKRALTALIRRTASGALVSNERKAFANETKRLDILVEQQGTSVAIELKYPVRRLEVEIQGDYYALKDQAAQDLTRYDFVKDIRRLERAVEASPQMVGYAILLTNDSAYWKPPSRSDTADACFRLHEGAGLGGTRQWASSASPGTTKDREQALNLEGAYHLSWRDYSTLPVQQSYNRFRYLLVPVSRNDATAPHQSS